MKISIIGTRGIPAKYGGFETFAEEITPRLVQNGFDIAVQCDQSEKHYADWFGAKLYYSSYTKSTNPLKYYFDGIRWGLKNSDIVLIAGTGGSIFYFLNIFHRKIIITNTDGIESGRVKWSLLKRWYVKISEIFAVWFSDSLIADSIAVSQYLINKYRFAERKIDVVEYGAYLNELSDPVVLNKYNVRHEDYYLIICRIEPENNLMMILEGFSKAKTYCTLLIVGPLKNSRFCENLVKTFKSDRIRFLGGIYDKHEISSLRSSCKAYIHGHSVGGTNPSLLEAMGSGNLIICHDNVFNREVTSDSQLYFKSPSDLTESINLVEILPREKKKIFQDKGRERIISYYNWDNILTKYSGIFKKFLTF
jgi:glycosyltransferase involved in cell wall biosynthesis